MHHGRNYSIHGQFVKHECNASYREERKQIQLEYSFVVRKEDLQSVYLCMCVCVRVTLCLHANLFCLRDLRIITLWHAINS